MLVYVFNLQQTSSSQEVGIHYCATVAFRLLYSAIPYAGDYHRTPYALLGRLDAALCDSISR